MRYRFSHFTLDTERFELCRAGQPIRAEPQVIELLALLVEHNDRMVSKEEINDVVWRGRVVSDSALSSRIKMARQLLDDSARSQSYIRTIHKKGFRFVHPVEHEEGDAPRRRTTDWPARRSDESLASTAQASAAAADAEPATQHAPTANPARPAIMVLPFANLSDTPGQDYFSDGVTADIIARLSKHRWLHVLARNTSFGYRNRPLDVRRLHADPGVDYVVEGSVQRVSSHVRVTAQMSDCRTGHTRWSERYDREMVDIFDLQDEITATIAARLEPEIGFAERNRVVRARPANLQAWDLCHLGVHHLFRFTKDDNVEAQRLLLRARALDPQLGEAYAWWAYALVLGMVYWEVSPTAALLDEALDACDAALGIDPQDATFHALRARVRLARREYAQAIVDNQTAISLNPSFAAAYCGLGDSLAYEKRYDEAIAYFREAIALSPNDPQMWAFLTYGALVLIFKQDFATALEWTERASALPNHQYWTTAHRMVALACLDRSDEAHQAADILSREMPGFSSAFARGKLFYLKDPGQIELYLTALRKAGVPEA